MKKRTKGKRLLAAALSILLAVNTMTMPAFAKEQTDQGLCEHHQEHTEDCGYKEAQPCIHEHTDACYTDDLICSYIMDEENIASDSDAEHTHTQECYALDCPHERGEHDDGCGYEKAAPCSYACAECAATDSDASVTMITAFEDLEDHVKVQSVPLGTPQNSLELPDTLGAFGYPVDGNTESAPEPKAVTIENVTWKLTGEDNSPTEYEEERITSCTYYFQAVLPEGYDLAGIAVLPQIEVRCGWDYRMVRPRNQGSGYTFDPDTGHLIISSADGMRNADWQDPGRIGSIISVKIDDSITVIPDNTFINCTNLTTITLPANLIEIQSNAFMNCQELTLDALPDTVERIGVSAFMYCKKLALTSLPSSIKCISGQAFNGCKSISSLTFTGPNAPILDTDAFANTTFPIYVPENGSGYNTGTWANYASRVTSGAALSSLTISSGDLEPQFDPSETSYTVSVGSGTNVITVTPTFDGSGTITVNENPVTSGEPSNISLEVGETEISINVITVNGDSRTYNVKVTREPVPVAAVTLNQSSFTLYTNKDPNAFKLSATVQPADASDTTVRWESSNTSVATVDVDGTINAVAPGNATITAITNDGGKTASCSVTVRTYSSSDGNDDSDDSNAYTTPYHLHGTWIQTDTGNWMFRQAIGAYVKNRWGMVDGQWYYFDAEGRMLTGWQFLNGQWYYLYTKEDSAAKDGIKEGAMASGWHFDPAYQKWFYLDTSGAMVTGWREINGKWYYFNPVSDGTRGCMVTDLMVDGWYIDKDGIRNGKTKEE